MGCEEEQIGRRSPGSEPRRREPSQDLPKESGWGFTGLLFLFKKTLGLKCSEEDRYRESRHRQRKAGFLERHHPVPSEARFRVP